MNMVSKYISYLEATKSANAIRFGISNHPDPKELLNMEFVATRVFDQLREWHGGRIGISSFFRSKKLNSLTPGSSPTSQHCSGEAIDIDADIYGGITNGEIFKHILQHLPFDQLIWEFGNDESPDWVHVSLKEEGNRHLVLRSKKSGNKTVYEKI